MKNVFLFLSFFLLITAITNCKKESNTDSSMKHTGIKWNIDSLVNYSVTYQSGSTQDIKTGLVALNIGSFWFDANGTGSYDYTIAGYRREGIFTYNESGSTLTINYFKQTINGTSVTQQSYIFDSYNKTLTNMTLEGSEINQTSTTQFIMTGTFYLKKQ